MRRNYCAPLNNMPQVPRTQDSQTRLRTSSATNAILVHPYPYLWVSSALRIAGREATILISMTNQMLITIRILAENKSIHFVHHMPHILT
jgi:hypothetical protein